MGKLKNLTGKQFERWTVISYAGRSKWNCKCRCGVKRVVTGSYLRSGLSKSCGCYQSDRMKKENGISKHPLYTRWKCMWRRTTDPKLAHYKYYGGRGITVDPRWKSFLQFVSDMGEPPSIDSTIERKDNDKGYSKENCIWATMKEQNNNKRSNTKLTFSGKTQSLAEWARELNMSYNGLHRRVLNSRLSGKDVFSKCKRSHYCVLLDYKGTKKA